MGDFTLVDPKGWEYDLHSIYSAYIGYFQQHNVQWYNRSWGHLFSSFEDFLAFSWPVITVTDACTGRSHIVTRLTSLGAFIKMIKTRFGETLPQAPNILKVAPFETANRLLWTISDHPSYKKLHSTLPAIALAAFKARVRAGEPKAVRELWERRDKTFLAVGFEWSERNEKSCLEFGYAGVRCGHLEALGHWPPVPDTNYRKGHFIVADYLDKNTKKYCPNFPWQYAFGDSQVIGKSKLSQVIQAVISSFVSPDSETKANELVLVGHGIQADLPRLEEMKIKIPHNVLILDLGTYERALYNSGSRGNMVDPTTGKSRSHRSSMLSLESLLRSFNGTSVHGSSSEGSDKDKTSSSNSTAVSSVHLPNCVLHNSGNDAFMCLFAMQKLLDPSGTQVPNVKKSGGGGGHNGHNGIGNGRMMMMMMAAAAARQGMVPQVMMNPGLASHPHAHLHHPHPHHPPTRPHSPHHHAHAHLSHAHSYPVLPPTPTTPTTPSPGEYVTGSYHNGYFGYQVAPLASHHQHQMKMKLQPPTSTTTMMAKGPRPVSSVYNLASEFGKMNGGGGGGGGSMARAVSGPVALVGGGKEGNGNGVDPVGEEVESA
ncbi:hypothetical protein AMATHDRAFT_67894 [Amanita thiersii Skay4041]|uniref:Gfd2/YDR514C-like C-terminal domain-containing protein n=1 Tax=Amanita thiersii Skay4041 TaxID=703135 RepID=A0A2A9NBC7_9AGAR|nr:hypothetical protein AMATHDRAFT_67894 [Amanita thiersii Skay4041]